MYFAVSALYYPRNSYADGLQKLEKTNFQNQWNLNTEKKNNVLKQWYAIIISPEGNKKFCTQSWCRTEYSN